MPCSRVYREESLGELLFADQRKSNLSRVLVFNQICGNRRRFWTSLPGDLQQTQQFLRLFFV